MVDRGFGVQSGLQPRSRSLSLSQQRETGLELLPDPRPGRAAGTHLLFGAGHLEAGAEVVQPFPLLVPPQALQVLPQHLDDLEQEAGLSCPGSS